MKLYEIDYELEMALSGAIDPETGEILNDELLERIEALSLAKENKIEDCLLFYKGALAEAVAIKAEEKALAERRKALENKAEWIKGYVASSLQGNPFNTTRVKASFRKSEETVIEDINLLPEIFLKYKNPEADKTAIKKAIKGGETIPGAHIEEKLNMSIK